MNSLFPLPVSVALAMLLLSSSTVAASLSGDVSLTYSRYEGSASTVFVKCPGSMNLSDDTMCIKRTDDTYRVADGSERNKMSSSALVQNYSLLYSSSGPIYNSRVGSYNLSLGYNWTGVNAHFKTSSLANPTPPGPDFRENLSETRGHLMFLGEVKIDPKEIPFKLNAYSRDMGRNAITSDGGTGTANVSSVVGGFGQPTNINDGMHIESGVTLIAGVKNGMTNGYNELLRHFPMILIDYKDSVNKDLLSLNPVDDRLSRLAFVSLNKKDNWFHYRNTRYTDNINPLNNYEENQFQLGTVDQYMARRWIDFSNWIKVSTDMQVSSHKLVGQTNSTDEIDLNMFVAAERSNWNARAFNTFNRSADTYKNISYQTALPLFVSGTVNQDISWSARTAYRENHDIQATGVRTDFRDMLVGYRLNTFSRAPFTLSQSFDVESSSTDLSDNFTISGKLETNSTARFARAVSFGASYNIRNSAYTSTTPETSKSGAVTSGSNFLVQTLILNAGYVPTNTLRFNISQSNTFTQGENTQLADAPRNAQTQLSQGNIGMGGVSSSNLGKQSYQSSSSISAAWNPKPRLNINLGISEDINKSDVMEAIYSTNLNSAISYSSSTWDAKNTFTYGRNSTQASTTDTFTDSLLLNYVHSRNLRANLSAINTATPATGFRFRDTSYAQGLNYSYYTKSGITRKLFDFYESLSYTGGVAASSATSLRLGLNYYPISRLTLSGGIGFTPLKYSNPFHSETLVWNASATANFKLLQASLDYASGKRISDNARDNRLTGNIRKSF